MVSNVVELTVVQADNSLGIGDVLCYSFFPAFDLRFLQYEALYVDLMAAPRWSLNFSYAMHSFTLPA